MPGFCIILSSASGGLDGPRTPCLKGGSLRSLHFPPILKKNPSTQNLNETTTLSWLESQPVFALFFILNVEKKQISTQPRIKLIIICTSWGNHNTSVITLYIIHECAYSINDFISFFNIFSVNLSLFIFI